MDMNSHVGFLGEAVNITFAAIEVSILIAYLVVVSIYQVAISGIFSSQMDLPQRLTLKNTKRKLKILRAVSIITAAAVLISTIAVLFKVDIVDFASLSLFIVVILIFTGLLIVLINNLLQEGEM